jgi:hypothetical protein
MSKANVEKFGNEHKVLKLVKFPWLLNTALMNFIYLRHNKSLKE